MRAAFYKGTREGLPGLYNRAVRFWDRGPYSHCELVFAGDIAWSASYLDKGVRVKTIQFDPAKWDFIDLPDHLAKRARQWFVDHDGQKYDIWGNVGFLLDAIADDKDEWFCSEAIAAALGLHEPWRHSPNRLYAALLDLTKPAPAGFFLSPD